MSTNADFFVTWHLRANDEGASNTMSTLYDVMKNGQSASQTNITQFKEMRQNTRLQTQAMSEAAAQWRASNSSLVMFGRAMNSVGAIGSTVLNITQTLATAQLNYAVNQSNLAGATQAVTDAQNEYNQAVATFGPNSVQALDALTKLHEAQNQLAITQAQVSMANNLQTLSMIGVALSAAGMTSQVITAAGGFSGLSEAIGGVGVGTIGAVAGLAIGLGLLAYGVYNTMGKIQQLNLTTHDTTTSFHDLLNQQQQTGDYLGVFVTSFTYGLYLIGQAIVGLNKPLTSFFGGSFPGALHGALGVLSGFWDSMVSGFSQLWIDIVNGAQGLGGSITEVIKGAINLGIGVINGAIGGINNVIDTINAGLGKVGLSIPTVGTVPTLAQGGIVNSPTLALIGEAGPEAVVPLGGSRGAGGGTTIINVNVAGSISTLNDITTQIDRALQMRYSLKRRMS